MKAPQLLAENISGLLRLRCMNQHDLAQWCRKSDVWLSYFLSGKREIQLADLDRIADGLGVATYQLFQPGIVGSAERRRGERRSGQERRISHATRVMMATSAEIDAHHPRRKGPHVVVASPLMAALDHAAAEHAKRIDAIISRFTEPRHEASTARGKVATPRPRSRAAGRSDSETP